MRLKCASSLFVASWHFQLLASHPPQRLLREWLASTAEATMRPGATAARKSVLLPPPTLDGHDGNLLSNSARYRCDREAKLDTHAAEVELTCTVRG